MWDFILTDRPVRISIQKYSCISLLSTPPFHELYLKVLFFPVFIIGALALYPILIHFIPPVVPLSRTDAKQDWRKRTNWCHIYSAQKLPKRNANPNKPPKVLVGQEKARLTKDEFGYIAQSARWQPVSTFPNKIGKMQDHKLQALPKDSRASF